LAATDKADIVNQLAGIEPGSPLADLRAQRSEVQQFTQGSYLALLEPDDHAGVSREEREAIGLRVATLERSRVVADFHLTRLRELGVDDATISAIEQFPDGDPLPERLAAILRHADMLTRSSRSGSPAVLAALRAAGLTGADIVTVSQLIAYLSFEIRVLATLRALGDAA
jgi:CMD domain protein